MIEDEEYIEFYNLEVVRKIIDFQYTTTRKFLSLMFKFYGFGFLIPFMISLSVQSIIVLNICYTLCFFTQVFFIMFELIQIKEQKLDYFKDVYNIVDSSQFVFFILLYISKMVTQFQSNSIFEIFLESFIIVQAFYKIIYYVRIYDSFLFLITMVTKIFADIIPFVIFVFVALMGFCKIFQVLQMGINDPEHEMAQIKSPMLKLIFQTYQSTQGRKVAPVLNSDMNDRLADSPGMEMFMLILVTIIWLACNSFFAFFGTTFMAQVYQAYEKFMPKMKMYGYRAKARFNEENFQILDLFNK